MQPSSNEWVVRSFERAAERCEDLTPLVYERLFREHPPMRELFVLDRDGSVQGNMLATAINAVLDFVGDGAYGGNMIRAEAVNHFGNGLAGGEFPVFFHVLGRTLQDVLGEAWSPEIAAAWDELLAELDATVAAVQAGA